MKNKIKEFGFVFPVKSGRHAGKFIYCYKNKDGINKHSKVFKSLESCSQEFAQKFAEHVVRGMLESIKNS